MNKKAGMWAFNFLLAVGLIAIFLFGLFLLMAMIAPKNVASVKATVAEINTGSQLINFFRIPVNNQIIADLTCETGSAGIDFPDCSDLRKALVDFYGQEVSYKLRVNKIKKCEKSDLGKNSVKLDLILPDYTGKLHNIILEVES